MIWAIKVAPRYYGSGMRLRSTLFEAGVLVNESIRMRDSDHYKLVADRAATMESRASNGIVG